MKLVHSMVAFNFEITRVAMACIAKYGSRLHSQQCGCNTDTVHAQCHAMHNQHTHNACTDHACKCNAQFN